MSHLLSDFAYTYGDMHSYVAVSMEDFGKEREYVKSPLIPLKGKMDFLYELKKVVCYRVAMDLYTKP